MNFTITLNKTNKYEKDFNSPIDSQNVSLLVIKNKSIDSDISSIDLSQHLSKILSTNKKINHIMFEKINFNQLDNPFEWISTLSSELELNFHDCLLKSKIDELNTMIASSKFITKLWLIRVSDLDHEDTTSFSSALSSNTSIKFIFIDGIPVSKDFLCSCSGNNKTLENLSLTDINLQEDDAISFIQSLSDNMNVKTLRLMKCKLYDHEIIFISESLSTNTTVKLLCLSFNTWGFEGSKALANLVLFNKSITSLNLSCNENMTTEGINFILSALENNHTLSELMLVNTGFNDDNAFTLVNALSTNFTRRKIYLRDNDSSLTSKGRKILKELTPINPSISFDLDLDL